MKTVFFGFTVLRGLLVAISIFLITVVLSLLVVFVALVFRSPDFAYLLVKHLWARPILFLAGIEVEYREEPGLPQKGFLYTFNHTSYNDILAMLASLPKPPKFGAKTELFRIPFFGVGMRAVGILEIHRDQREKVLQMYRDAKVRVERGEHFALAPEGTRQVDDELGRFKKGPFIFAIHSEMPIVPLLIVGARQTQPKGQYLMNLGVWRRKIVVKALAPIEASQDSDQTLAELQQRVRDKMAEEYAVLREELGL